MLKNNDKIYGRLKNILSSAEVVRKNLNMGGGEIAARMGVNILSSSISAGVNFTMGMAVPIIGAAPAILAGITGTMAGDVVNTIIKKLVDTDFTQTLDMNSHLDNRGSNPLSNFVKDVIAPRLKDYAFAMATHHSFPYAVSETREASSGKNYITSNISDASNLFWYKGELAKKAYHDSKVLLKEVELLEALAFANIGSDPDVGHTIAGATMTKSSGLFGKKRMIAEFMNKVSKTRKALEELQDDALRIGYPVGWVLRHDKSRPITQGDAQIISDSDSTSVAAGEGAPDVQEETERSYVPGSIPANTAAARAQFFATWEDNFGLPR